MTTMADRPGGPFETEQQARELPAVREVYAAFRADPGVGKMTPHNQRMLLDALAAAGVYLGGYDHRIAEWLVNWEPQTVAVIAGWVQRAARQADDQSAARTRDGPREAPEGRQPSRRPAAHPDAEAMPSFHGTARRGQGGDPQDGGDP